MNRPRNQPTSIDDVRRVREKIAREHDGDLRKHVEKSSRVGGRLRAKLKVRLVAAPRPQTRRSGTGG